MCTKTSKNKIRNRNMPTKQTIVFTNEIIHDGVDSSGRPALSIQQSDVGKRIESWAAYSVSDRYDKAVRALAIIAGGGEELIGDSYSSQDLATKILKEIEEDHTLNSVADEIERKEEEEFWDE